MINIIVSSDPRYNINRDAIKDAIIDSLKKHRVTGRVEIGVSIIGDRKMHELNRKYRGIDSTADILSFALEDPNPVGFVSSPDRWLRLGDIVISYAQALEDASLDGISVEDEIKDLVEHGVDHLLGIHHQ